MIARLGSALRRTVRIALERPRATAWTLAAVACALFAVGAAAIAADNAARWAGARTGSGASMVVYLGEGADLPGAQRLAGELGRVPGVEHVEVVPPEETARRLQQALGDDPALLDGVDVASLPPSLEATLAPGMRDVLELSPTMAALRRAPGVAQVAIEDAGENHVATTLATMRAISWTGAAVFGALGLVLVLAIVRLRLERGRREQAVLHLLGASPSYTIVPAALAGALHGALAALAAMIALALALAHWGDAIVHALSASLGSVHLVVPAAPELVLFVVLGAALGMLGGALAGASRAAA